MLIPTSLFVQLHGFDSLTSPHLEDSDFCLRAQAQAGVTTVSSGAAIGISLLAHSTTIDTTPDYTSKLFSPLKMSKSELEALREYSLRWREVERQRKAANYLTSAKLTWVIHCGGSQGLEAATILQTLYQ
jgi:GT2 family glycosyltransferase